MPSEINVAPWDTPEHSQMHSDMFGHSVLNGLCFIGWSCAFLDGPRCLEMVCLGLSWSVLVDLDQHSRVKNTATCKWDGCIGWMELMGQWDGWDGWDVMYGISE